MKKTISVISPSKPILKRKTRVAAYARVSSGKDAMLMSLSAQVSYYNDLIQKNPEWEFVGVYADEAMTGTKEDRENFQKLLTACRNGEVDIILTKSISRFSRNTVTLLEAVRELKRYNVDVYFERENIHSLSGDGELMLTILASFAQEESLSSSENQKWRIKKNFEEGKPWSPHILGYRLVDGKFEIDPEEAEIVRRIYREYLEGNGCLTIAKNLEADGVPTRKGTHWHPNTLNKILHNYNYTGNLLLQKTFRENHITKKTRVNEGQLPKYLVEESHDAIIPLETFEAVQREMARRAEENRCKSHPPITYPYTGMITCAKCGKHYRRKTTRTQVVWICATFNMYGKSRCASKQIPETTLDAIIQENSINLGSLEKIVADDNNTLHFHFKNGAAVTYTWQDRSRSASWTDEMKEQARQKTLERRKNNGKIN